MGAHDAASLERLARTGGFETLFQDGLRKAAAGHTSLGEVLGVVAELPGF